MAAEPFIRRLGYLSTASDGFLAGSLRGRKRLLSLRPTTNTANRRRSFFTTNTLNGKVRKPPSFSATLTAGVGRPAFPIINARSLSLSRSFELAFSFKIPSESLGKGQVTSSPLALFLFTSLHICSYLPSFQLGMADKLTYTFCWRNCPKVT